MDVMDSGFYERHHEVPDEVLIHIFSFLDAWDRRNVRRTCSAWYDACNSIQILKTEKLRIEAVRVFHLSTLVFDTLITSQLKFLNLEFKKFKFEECSLQFWKNCGSRILSLTFEECYFENGTIFHEILVNCVNLQYLEINGIYWKCIPPDDVSGISIEAICEGFNRFKSENKKLITLKLKNCSFLDDLTYTNIVCSFPNVNEILLESLRNLNFSHRADRRFYLGTEQTFRSEDIFSFSCVFNHLKSNASQIKSLSLHNLPCGLTPYWCRKLAGIPNLKLQCLSLIDHKELTEDSLASLLSKQTELIEIHLHHCCSKIGIDTFHRLIRNRPKLECVDYRTFLASENDYDPEDDQLVLSLLFSMNLKKVTFNHNPREGCGACYVKDKHGHPRVLMSEKDTMYSIQESVKTFHNLTSLTLYSFARPKLWKNVDMSLNINNIDLQIIFHNLKQLKTFEVFLGPDVSDYGFTGVEDDEHYIFNVALDVKNRNWTSSIRNLINLETLVMWDCCCGTRVTSRTFNELVLPNLKSLKLSFGGKCLDDEFVKNLSTNSPMLRYLSLDFGENQTSFRSFLQFKQLATLKVKPANNEELELSVDDYRNLLSTKDSLKYCQIPLGKSSEYIPYSANHLAFFRDLFTQEWVYVGKRKPN